MTTTVSPSTATSRSRGRRLGVAAVAGLLAATGVTTSAASAHAAPAEVSAALAEASNCTLVDYDATTYVECVVNDSGAYTFTDIVPEPLAPHAGTSVIMTARGGEGWATSDDWRDRTAGAGGVARTVASVDDIDEFHVYVGRDGTRGEGASRVRGGGSSTIVSEVALEELTNIDDTYVVAGGGGARGARFKCGLTLSGAGSGGDGGVADANHANTGNTVTGAGRDGGHGTTWACSGSQTGNPGRGGNLGSGGIQPGDRRSDGNDGIGGRGGDTPWQGDVASNHEAGRGGASSIWAQGGGGWGGGSAGERNGGGGGGGSYARAVTDHLSLPRNYASTPSVTLAWPMNPPTT